MTPAIVELIAVTRQVRPAASSASSPSCLYVQGTGRSATGTGSVDAGADANRFPKGWLFHRRWTPAEGLTTPAGEPIEFVTLAGRTTAWVPSKQR